jgi:hypothetical protein
MIIMLIYDDACEKHFVSPLYTYISSGLYPNLREDVASFHLATEERLAMQHIAVLTTAM